MCYKRAKSVLVVCVVLACASPLLVDAKDFLGRVQVVPTLTDPNIDRGLLADIEVALGSEHRSFIEKRLQRIEQDLRQIVVAMPKTANGNLQHAAVGYVLHRAFVERHGWLVRNLAPDGNSLARWEDFAPKSILKDRVPQGVIEAFEKRGGTSIHELAVLAATLEHLVHQESLDKLDLAYAAHSFTTDAVLTAKDTEAVLEVYMTMYILGDYFKALGSRQFTPKKILYIRKHVSKMYPNWPETRRFMLDVKQDVAPKREDFHFADVASVVEEIGEHFGKFQDRECVAMKSQLFELELPRAGGRVRLGDFYKPAVDSGNYAFTESIGYLRQLGALDESDPANPRVIISNYVNSPSNCIAASSYYSVCCRDECEGLLAHLERELHEPDASVAQITALVKALPSRTEKANRTLSPWLLARLEDVAVHHGGRVPIHGRLFAQWMHYAYPRECPYPHVSGATRPQRLEDTLTPKKDIRPIMATLPEMQKHIDAVTKVTEFDRDATMWTLEEELFVPRADSASGTIVSI